MWNRHNFRLLRGTYVLPRFRDRSLMLKSVSGWKPTKSTGFYISSHFVVVVVGVNE